MENLGFLIYICSILNGIITLAIIAAAVAFLISLWNLFEIGYSCCAEEADEYYSKLRKGLVVLGIASAVIIFTPSKMTCYQIFGVKAAVELYRNSESLQQVPKKSVDALNRILDSIAKEDNQNK